MELQLLTSGASEAALRAELAQLEARLTRAETGLIGLREQLRELHSHIAADMHDFESNLKTQSDAIDSARTAMAQTDDLVERVVEALESLQSTVLEPSAGRVLAVR